MSVRPMPPVERDHYRHVVGHFASGVAVLTTKGEAGPAGMTISALASLSLDPPMLLVCVNRSVPTQQSIATAGSFCVNILAETQHHLALQFARPSLDKFDGVHTRTGVLGDPVLHDALAQIECEVVDEVEAGSHTIFVGQVRSARARDGLPLTYFRGGFGGLTLERFDEVYQSLRAMLLRRELGAGQALDIDDLYRKLGFEPPAIMAALSTLTRERLAQAVPGGFAVAPFTVADAAEAFDARAMIEIGVAEVSLRQVTQGQLDHLNELLDEMATFVVDDEFTDFEAYLEANDRFHRSLVGLSGNRSAVAMYRSLAIPVVMAQSFGVTHKSSQQFIDVQRQIVAGYQSNEIEQVREATRLYSTLATERARVLLESSGGSI